MQANKNRRKKITIEISNEEINRLQSYLLNQLDEETKKKIIIKLALVYGIN